MSVVRAEQGDVPAWLTLAAEVEPLFGPMVDQPEFLAALARNIARGSAWCVRQDDGPAGAPLLGGLLFSAKPPVYRIGWLAVTASARRLGIGRMLIEHALAGVQPPAEVVVTTFVLEDPSGGPARAFYAHLGLQPAERVDTPFGPRQMWRRTL